MAPREMTRLFTAGFMVLEETWEEWAGRRVCRGRERKGMGTGELAAGGGEGRCVCALPKTGQDVSLPLSDRRPGRPPDPRDPGLGGPPARRVLARGSLVLTLD